MPVCGAREVIAAASRSATLLGTRLMDTVDRQTRSRMMSSVRAKDTRIEVALRQRLFRMGFRFRLHRADLPGRPDIVFTRFSAVILVHGCFWHLHGCARSKLPATRRAWWRSKLQTNRQRDMAEIQKLRDLGWRVMVIWECSMRKSGAVLEDALDKVACRAARFLESRKAYLEIPEPPRERRFPPTRDTR